MSTFSGYTTKTFSPTQKFFVLDPNTGTPSFVQGSDLVAQLTPNSSYVFAESTRTTAQATDYELGKVIQTGGATSIGDGQAGVYLVVAAGAGDFPMDNGLELLTLAGDDTLLERLAPNTVGDGSDLVAHTGTTDTVTQALDKRTIYVGSVAESLSGLSVGDGAKVSVTGWHSGSKIGGGDFVFRSSVAKSDHNGGTIVSPTVPPVSQQAGATLKERIGNFLNGQGETDPTGVGAFVSTDGLRLSASSFGSITGENNTRSLQKMASVANSISSGFSVSVDVEGLIFDETINPSPSSNESYYQSLGDVLSFTGCKNFTVEFLAEQTTAPGIHYGSFDPLTGEVYTPPAGGFTDFAYAAVPGKALRLYRCSNYTVRNPSVDGNSANLVVGGYWGDTGIQLRHVGQEESESTHGTTQNPKYNNFGLDGMYIRGVADQEVNITHVNPECHYNGRQGLSITGGGGITLINPSYSYTGRGAIQSLPAAGLDIEDNGENPYRITLISPSILDNAVTGILSLNNASQVTVHGGVIVQRSGGAIWSETPITVYDTEIHGTLRNISSESEFHNVTITDEPKFGLIIASQILLENVSPSALFENVTINSSLIGSMYITGGVFRNCKLLFSANNPATRARAGVIQNAILDDVEMIQQYTNLDPSVEVSGEATYIDVSNVTQRGRTTISGSALAWAGRTGAKNTILSATKNGKFIYSEELITPVDNGDGTFDINLGNGSNIWQITKTNGNASLRNFSATFLQNSSTSTAASNHSLVNLGSAGEANFGTGFSITTLNIGSDDIVRLTEGTVSLSGEQFVVTRKSLVGYGNYPL